VAEPSVGVRFLGHATVLLELDGRRVLTDPFFGRRLGPLQRHGPLPDPGALEVDLVLISHGHPDHFSVASLAALPGSPTVVVPRRLGRHVPAHLSNVIELEAGEATSVGGLSIRAAPARHWISPGAPRAQPIGYLLEGSSRIWFAGDTGPDPRVIGAVRGVDLALVPVWTWGPHRGPGHLGPRSAAEVVAEVEAAAAVPIHWATLYPRLLHRVWQRPLSQPGEHFAAHVRRLSPTTKVSVLQPGNEARVRGGRA
jgi:L-ascorbate metabolism protein UlaG (beta-lactamase superfamily)